MVPLKQTYEMDLLTPTPVGESLRYGSCIQMKGICLRLRDVVVDSLVMVVHCYTQDLFSTLLTHHVLV